MLHKIQGQRLFTRASYFVSNIQYYMGHIILPFMTVLSTYILTVSSQDTPTPRPEICCMSSYYSDLWASQHVRRKDPLWSSFVQESEISDTVQYDCGGIFKPPLSTWRGLSECLTDINTLSYKWTDHSSLEMLRSGLKVA